MSALLLSFGIVFVAELGDKSQLMVVAFAARYRPLHVLVGIAVAAGVVNAASVLVGGLVGDRLPTDIVNIGAGIVFVVFAVITVAAGGDDDTEPERRGRSPIVTVGVAFLLAELGDKTMLATITLAATEDPFGTWVGATAAMVAAGALAVFVGRQLGDRLGHRAISIGTAVVFAVVGIWLIVEGISGRTT